MNAAWMPGWIACAEIDVADHPAIVGSIDEQLDELVVLDDRDARLALRRIDENFAFHSALHGLTRGATPLARCRSQSNR
jgi:hypothetical protein